MKGYLSIDISSSDKRLESACGLSAVMNDWRRRAVVARLLSVRKTRDGNLSAAFVLKNKGKSQAFRTTIKSCSLFHPFQ